MKILYNMCTQANYFTHKDKCPTWCTVSYRSDRWQRLLVCVHCSLHPILMAPTKRSYNNIHTTPLHSNSRKLFLPGDIHSFRHGLINVLKVLEIVWVYPDELEGVIPAGIHFIMSVFSEVGFLY